MKELIDSEMLVQKLKAKNWVFAFGLLVLSSIITGLSVFLLIGTILLMAPTLGALVPIAGTIVAGFVAVFVIVEALIAALFLKAVVKTLTGTQKGYYEAFASWSAMKLWFSFGMLASAILSIIPFIGLILSPLAFMFFAAKSFAVLFRALKELYETDYQTVLSAIIIFAAIVIALSVVSFVVVVIGLAFAALSIMQDFMKSLPLGLGGF